MVSDDPESFADLDGHCGDGTAAACAVLVSTEPANQIAAHQNTAQQSSVAKDVTVGALKEIGNTIADVAPGGGMLGSLFTASSDTQAKAMTGVALLALLVPGGGEEKVAAKVETKVEQAAETLFRQGVSKESVARLSRKAAEAEEKIGKHGVSTWNKMVGGESSKAARAAVERIFKVENTGPPGHRTVYLPKPVTQAVADAFNRLFGRIP
jgi:hypothetical protein